MIFVTLGTQNFPFRRLLEMVDRLVGEGIIKDEVIAQTGHTSYFPKNYSCTDFLDTADYSRYITEADLVIAHAGVGTIMNCLANGKKLIVVPRAKKHDEHVDDHQFEIAEEFAKNGYLLCAEDYEELKTAVLSAPSYSFRKYEKSANRVAEKIDAVLHGRHCRVLMVGSDLSVKGGIVSVIKNYLDYDRWNDTDISFVPTHLEGSAWKKAWFFLKSLTKIRKLLDSHTFDAVHIHLSERGSFTRKAIVLGLAKRKRCKVILHHHGAEFLEFYRQSSERKQKRISRVINQADINLVLSRRLVSIYKEISPGAKVQCLYNSVKTPEQNQYNPEAREFTMLGRLAERKGTLALLDTIHMIDSVLPPDVKFNLCGDGNLELVKSKIKELQIEHRIGFLGWIDGNKKDEILNRTMAHVLFSYNEGLPMSILETMGRGIVNIATKVAAIPEVISDRETGFLVEAGDREQLAQVLLEVSSSASLRKQISDRAFALIAEEFSLETGIRRTEEFYREIV